MSPPLPQPDRDHGLSRRVDEACERWELVRDGAPTRGRSALVVPVRRGDEPLALKVSAPGPGDRHEALALRTWDGDGAVRLVAALPSDGLLLLERLSPDPRFAEVWADEACEVVGDLLRRLHVPAPPQVVSLSEHLGPHLEALASSAAVPRRVVSRTRGLARDLFPAAPRTLLHTDLHDGHVLWSATSGWTTIDPSASAGHPGYEVWPVLRGRSDELGSGASMRWSVRHRLTILAEAMGEDEEEVRAWTLLRAGLEVGRAAATGDEVAVTTCIALHKALDG